MMPQDVGMVCVRGPVIHRDGSADSVRTEFQLFREPVGRDQRVRVRECKPSGLPTEKIVGASGAGRPADASADCDCRCTGSLRKEEGVVGACIRGDYHLHDLAPQSGVFSGPLNVLEARRDDGLFVVSGDGNANHGLLVNKEPDGS